MESMSRLAFRRRPSALSTKVRTGILHAPDPVAFVEALSQWIRRCGFEVTLIVASDTDFIPEKYCQPNDLIRLVVVSPETAFQEPTISVEERNEPPVEQSSETDALRSEVSQIVDARRAKELTARERVSSSSANVLTWGMLTLYPLDQLAVVGGVETRLTPRQTRILARLVRASGRIVSNEEIWLDFDVAGNPILANIRFHMSALRRRIDPDRVLIETWAGKGYSLRSEARRAVSKI